MGTDKESFCKNRGVEVNFEALKMAKRSENDDGMD